MSLYVAGVNFGLPLHFLLAWQLLIWCKYSSELIHLSTFYLYGGW